MRKSFAAFLPKISRLSTLLKPGVLNTWSTGVVVQRNGKSVPITIWLAPHNRHRPLVTVSARAALSRSSATRMKLRPPNQKPVYMDTFE